MKPFEEFSLEDLNQYILEHKLLRTDLRSTDDKQIIDYQRLGDLLGLQHRAARCLVEERHKIKRYHYNLLALHAGAMEPELTGGDQEDVYRRLIDAVMPVLFKTGDGEVKALEYSSRPEYPPMPPKQPVG